MRRRPSIHNENKEKGIYLYCIVNKGEKTSFGEVGLENEPVYSIPYNDIGAVVHRCHAEPYQTKEATKAKDWILTHQYVIDLATERFGTVIPLTFDTIFMGDDVTVEDWIKDKYEYLKKILQKLKGKDEYGVQVYLENDDLKEMIENNGEIASLKKDLEGRSEGSAYLLGKRLKKIIEVQKNVETRNLANKLHKRITDLVDETRIERNLRVLAEKGEDKLMILNLFCLVQRDQVKCLGDLLGGINGNHGLTVRFTGPWPPYSFASKIETGGS